MSTITWKVWECSVCGRTSLVQLLGSSIEFGSSDLDFRPAPMIRNTMHHWIHRCKNCGYTASNLSKPTTVTAEWLNAYAIPTSQSLQFISSLAESFYCAYLIAVEEGQIDRAFTEVLRAAWVCDDREDTENAVLCRKTAIECLQKTDDNARSKETKTILMADLLRRCGSFADVKLLLADFQTSTAELDAIRHFQLFLANLKDDRCYTIEDAERFYATDVLSP